MNRETLERERRLKNLEVKCRIEQLHGWLDATATKKGWAILRARTAWRRELLDIMGRQLEPLHGVSRYSQVFGRREFRGNS